jgi:hypothetical protein
MNARHYERQLLDSYKKGFLQLLKEHEVYFRKIANYEKLFDKVFTVTNISSYKNLKITQVKVIVDNYAREKQIDLEDYES